MKFITLVVHGSIMNSAHASFRTVDDVANGRNGNKLDAPSWLVELGEPASAVPLLRKEVDHFQVYHNPQQWTDLGTRAKRARVNSTTYVANLEAGTRDALYIAVVAKQLNSDVKGRLTTIRGDLRQRFLREFMFLPLYVKVEFNMNLEAAKLAGYSVEFAAGAYRAFHVEENEAPAEIPLAITGGNDTSRTMSNKKKFEEMKEAYLGMSVTLCYRRQVNAPVGGKEAEEERYAADLQMKGGTHLSFDSRVHVSLFDFAVDYLVTFADKTNDHELFASSVYSSRAVYVIAVGLRGVIRKCLGLSLSPEETAASECVVDFKVPVSERRVASCIQERGLDATIQQKFSMAFREYKVAKDSGQGGFVARPRSVGRGASSRREEDENGTETRTTPNSRRQGSLFFTAGSRT